MLSLFDKRELINRKLLLDKIHEHPEINGNEGLIQALCCINDAPVVYYCLDCGVKCEEEEEGKQRSEATPRKYPSADEGCQEKCAQFRKALYH